MAGFGIGFGCRSGRCYEWSTEDKGASPGSWYIEIKRVRKYTRIEMERAAQLSGSLRDQRIELGERLKAMGHSRESMADCEALFDAVRSAQERYAAGDRVNRLL